MPRTLPPVKTPFLMVTPVIDSVPLSISSTPGYSDPPPERPRFWPSMTVEAEPAPLIVSLVLGSRKAVKGKGIVNGREGLEQAVRALEATHAHQELGGET